MTRRNCEEETNVRACDSTFEADPSDDLDQFDETGEVNDPNSPIWDGSPVQNDFYGDDSYSETNDIAQD